MFEDECLDRGVTKAFMCFMDWYMRTRMEEHTEASIQAMDRASQDLLFSLKVFRTVTGPLSEVFLRLYTYIFVISTYVHRKPSSRPTCLCTMASMLDCEVRFATFWPNRSRWHTSL
jgi:hypothetical protein